MTRPFRKPLMGTASFCAAIALAVVPFACVSASDGDLAAGRLTPEPSSVALAIDKLTRDTCGATWSLVDGNRAGTDVYVVSVYPEAGRAQQFNHFPSPGEIARFVAGNQILLQDPLNNVGTYCEYDKGDCHKGDGALNCYLDISRTTKDLGKAARLARSCNQKSIAFLGKKEVEILDNDQGKPFGNGRDLAGAELRKCVAERDAADVK